MHRSADFRYLFVNAFTLQMTHNEMTLRFGISEDVTRPDDSVLEQIGVVLTPSAAKLLSVLLSETLGNYEEMTGAPLKVDAAKLAKIKQDVLKKVPTPEARPKKS